MPLTKFHDVPDDIRLQALIDNCDDRREETYMKDLSRDELEIRRQKVAENCIKVNDLEEELKEIKADFKDRIDPMKTDNKHLLTEIKNRKAEVKGILFDFMEDGMMNSYDKDGDLVYSRRLSEQERVRQAKLFVAHSNTGTGE